MMRFIKNSNLPKGKVKSIICGELCEELNSYFDSLGIERFVIDANNFVDSAVKFHTDMFAFHMGDSNVILERNQRKLGRVLINKGANVHFTDKDIKGEYPSDIALNFALVSNYLIGKVPFADKKLLELSDSCDKISVNQGYCKCSCLVVSENAVITDDKSIFDALSVYSLECLMISKGDVNLPGHDYGFIGGASGKISETEVLFFGDVTKHRDYKKMADFIEKHGCKIVSLDFPLTDFGGIIPLTEVAE